MTIGHETLGQPWKVWNVLGTAAVRRLLGLVLVSLIECYWLSNLKLEPLLP